MPNRDKIPFLKREHCQKIGDTSVTLGEKHSSYSTDKNWVARFRTGHLSTEDEERSGRSNEAKFQKTWMSFIP
jgi:transposase